MFGHPCLYGMQCTGTEFASLCQYGRCKCQSGYTSIGYNCYPGRADKFMKIHNNVTQNQFHKCKKIIYNVIMLSFLVSIKVFYVN
uniref:EB domain-containing protein n=1 Tax=Magallana gigas TaxID=29159 RepID=K1P7C4_MAGGI